MFYNLGHKSFETDLSCELHYISLSKFSQLYCLFLFPVIRHNMLSSMLQCFDGVKDLSKRRAIRIQHCMYRVK